MKKFKGNKLCLASRIIPSGFLMKLLDKVYGPLLFHPDLYFSNSRKKESGSNWIKW